MVFPSGTRSNQAGHRYWTLIESAMSTLINGSFTLHPQPSHTQGELQIRPSPNGSNPSHGASHGWNRPQPQRPANAWQTAHDDRQRPPHNGGYRPYTVRPENTWQPEHNGGQRPPHNGGYRPYAVRPENTWQPEHNGGQRPPHNGGYRPYAVRPENTWQPEHNGGQRPPHNGGYRPYAVRPENTWQPEHNGGQRPPYDGGYHLRQADRPSLHDHTPYYQRAYSNQPDDTYWA
jgi:hypothetical protein